MSSILEGCSIFLTGFHGTNQGEKIITEKRFIPSLGNRHWLGDGVYFFEDEDEAWSWSEKVAKASQPAVVKAKIICKQEFFFDLLKTSNQKRYNEFISKVRDKTEKNLKKPQDGRFLNLMNAINPFDVVRASFHTHLNLDIMEKYSSITTMQVQICVRNPSSIQSDSITKLER